MYDLPDWHAMRPSERRELALRLGQNLVSLGEFIEEVAPWEAMKANGHRDPGDVEAWAARNPVLSCAGAQPGGEWRARCPAGQ